jgi:hypothetical protein
MTLIDLYVAEVGKRLPMRTRADIENELRSTLQDMLEDRSRKAGRPVDDEMVKDLLREYGPPDKVAATYHSTQYLIGPRLYPFFVMVLRIVLSVLSVVLLVTLGIQLGSEPLQGVALAGAIAKGIAGIIGSAIGAFGNIALVFAILERVMPASEFKFDEEKKEWDPASLLKQEAKTEVKLWEPIIAVLLTVAAMVLFNGYPELLGAHFLRNGQWISFPVLTEAFFRWLPYINILWALQIALQLVLLRQGRWQNATKWASIAISAAGILIGYFLLSGAPIASLSPGALQAMNMTDPAAAAKVSLAVEQGTRGIIALIMVLEGVDVVKDVIRMVLKRR